MIQDFVNQDVENVLVLNTYIVGTLTLKIYVDKKKIFRSFKFKDTFFL